METSQATRIWDMVYLLGRGKLMCLLFLHFFQVVWCVNIQASRGHSRQLADHPGVDLLLSQREISS